MLTNPDFRELLSIFKKFNVKFLVVDGYAVMRYAEPRFTKDLDLWVGIDPENAQRTFDALKAFGAPLTGLTPADFTDPASFYQMGKPPLRVDIMFFLTGMNFDHCWTNRENLDLEGISIPFISLNDLIAAKKALGRPQDLLDLTNLEKARKR